MTPTPLETPATSERAAMTGEREVMERLASALQDLHDEADYQLQGDHPSPHRLAESVGRACEVLAHFYAQHRAQPPTEPVAWLHTRLDDRSMKRVLSQYKNPPLTPEEQDAKAWLSQPLYAQPPQPALDAGVVGKVREALQCAVDEVSDNPGAEKVYREALSLLASLPSPQPQPEDVARAVASVDWWETAQDENKSHCQVKILGDPTKLGQGDLLYAHPQPSGWRPISEYNDEWPIRIRAPELIDLDHNPHGETDACALCDPEWYAAKWNNEQDYFMSIRVNPTHWQPLPPPPADKEQGK